MSLILEVSGLDDVAVPIDLTWTLADFAAEVNAVLGLAYPSDAWRFDVGGEEWNVEGTLGDAGVVGAGERVCAEVKAEYVARADLARRGYPPEDVDKSTRGYFVAVRNGDVELVRTFLRARTIGIRELARGAAVAATMDCLGLFADAEGQEGEERLIPEGLLEEAFLLAVAMAERDDDGELASAAALERLAAQGLDLVHEVAAGDDQSTTTLLAYVYENDMEYNGGIMDALLRHGAHVEDALVKHPWAFEHAPRQWQGHRDVVLAVVQQYGDALEHAANGLRDDRDVVLAAVQNDGDALRHASGCRRGDREVVLEAVRNAGAALEYAHRALRSDRALVLDAVAHDGDALEFASEALREDREVVLTAVRQHGGALQYADSALQSDRAVVHAAVTANGYALEYASSDLRADDALVLQAVRQFGPALEYAAERLRDNEDIARAAVQEDSYAMEFVSTRLKSTVNKRIPSK
eukprot:TRINITY_DN30203_c0_g1_i1.p1 TRINITY_DN30203_c0_g1~~TRINITY_DN30203_c0_g1_i1.p1  ORF type:complete len:467 (+),score=134.40 TRINITY_DN30203_c0_g1_i1:44-1444(+)